MRTTPRNRSAIAAWLWAAAAIVCAGGALQGIAGFGMGLIALPVLLRVLQTLVEAGATVVVIEHDLDMIANADYVVDLGPGGGEAGGRIVCAGTPDQVATHPESVTGRYLHEKL